MTTLSQNEIDFLLNCDKEVITSNDYLFPTGKKNKLHIPLVSSDKKYSFILDIQRATFNLSKVTYQNRYTKDVPLVRLDLNASPHKNPDQTEVSGCHLHIYKEGYGDKFAIELPKEFEKINRENIEEILVAFMKYCHIIKTPNFKYKLQTGTFI